MIRISILRLKQRRAWHQCNGYISTNDKNLNSEIETLCESTLAIAQERLPMIRISILRLKRFSVGCAGGCCWPTNDKNLNSEIETVMKAERKKVSVEPINDKNLNSEIETSLRRCARLRLVWLSMIRISILRLKLTKERSQASTANLSMIRISILRLKLAQRLTTPRRRRTINDKNLNSEIETYTGRNDARPSRKRTYQ